MRKDMWYFKLFLGLEHSRGFSHYDYYWVQLKFLCRTWRFTRIWPCNFLPSNLLVLVSQTNPPISFRSLSVPTTAMPKPLSYSSRYPWTLKALSSHELHPFRSFSPVLSSSSHSLQTSADFSSFRDPTSSEFLQYPEAVWHDLAIHLAFILRCWFFTMRYGSPNRYIA